MSQFLTFTSGGVRLAIALGAISEIVPCDALTRVPHVPPFVRGVVNLHGRVLPVVDVAARLGLTGTGNGLLIVVDGARADDSAAIAFMVDEVDDVLAWDDDQIAAPPSFGLPIHASAVRGIANADADHVVVLDLERVIAELERSMAVAS